MTDLQTYLFKKRNFENWLKKNRAEIHTPHSEWELLRFYIKTKNSSSCGLIYRNAKDRLTFSPIASIAWSDFTSGRAFSLATPTTHLKPFGRERERLLAKISSRDGTSCIFCGLPCPESNVSIEHILDRNFHGSNDLPNLALAHPDCNRRAAGVFSLREKIELIIKMRRGE